MAKRQFVCKLIDWAGIIAVMLTIMAVVSLSIQIAQVSQENRKERERLVKLESFQVRDRVNVCAVMRPLKESSDPHAAESAKIAMDVYQCDSLGKKEGTK